MLKQIHHYESRREQWMEEIEVCDNCEAEYPEEIDAWLERGYAYPAEYAQHPYLPTHEHLCEYCAQELLTQKSDILQTITSIFQ